MKGNGETNTYGMIRESLRASGIGVWEWNVQTGAVIYDQSWLAILGYQEGDLTPDLSEWESRLHPEDREAVMKQVDLFLSQKMEVYQTDHRLLAKDGTWRWVRDTGRMVTFDETGRPLIAMGTHSDITTLKHLEDQYRYQLGQQALMTRVATLLNYSDDFRAAVNEALTEIGRFVDVSRIYIFEDDPIRPLTTNTFEWCNTGIEPQIQNLQEFPYDFVPSWNVLLDEEGQILASDIAEELPQDLQDALLPQNIRSILILPVQYSKEKRIGFIGFDQCDHRREWHDSQVELLKSCAGILSNAYKRRLSEQELLASRTHYKSLVETQTECIIRMDEQGVISFANASFAKTVGWEQDEEPIQSFFEYILEQDLEDIHHAISSLGMHQEKVFFENRFKTTKGIQWFGWDANLLELESGNEIQMVGRNTTKQRNYLQAIEKERHKAEQASLAKSNFVSKVSHELRTPMNSIIGFSELLTKEDLPRSSMSKIKSILSSSLSLKSLINDILDFTTIESNNIRIHETDFQVRPFVRDLMNAFQVMIPRNVALKMEVSENFPEIIRFDRTKLWQILNNLVGNSIKFTEKGEVKVRLEAQNLNAGLFNLVLEVADTGIGIPEDRIQDIFKSFEQVVYNGSQEYGGTGLGLAIVKAYVDMFAGQIDVSSRQGAGTRMLVTLPDIRIPKGRQVIQEPAQPRETATDSSESPVYKQADILIADDDPAMLKLICASLEPYTSAVITASDGQAALDLILEQKPDIAVLDLDMPRINGAELARRIRSHPDMAYMHLIAITGLNDIMLESGLFSTILIKPFSNAELLDAIESCMFVKKEEEASTQALFENWMKELSHDPAGMEWFRKIRENQVAQVKATRRINHFKELFQVVNQECADEPSDALQSFCQRFEEAIEVFDIVELEYILNLFVEHEPKTITKP